MAKRSPVSSPSAARPLVPRSWWLLIAIACKFPPSVSAQVPAAPAATVEQGAENLRHRAPIAHPQTAIQKRVQGRMSLVAAVDEQGNVYDAQAISGPMELRPADQDNLTLPISYLGQTVDADGESTPRRIRVGRGVMAGRLISSIPPEYPQEARDKGVQGTVLLQVILAIDGTVKELKAPQGPLELIPAALEAVKRWRYQLTSLNGEPVEVESEVSVLFSLGEGDRAK